MHPSHLVSALALVFAATLPCLGQNTEPSKPAPTDKATPAAATASKPKPAKIKALTADEQKELLERRLDGGMGDTFSQFANMFFVSSNIKLGTSVALTSSVRDVLDTELQSPFPDFYNPTLSEFLDAIALQTATSWKYDASGEQINDETGDGKALEDIAVYKFTQHDRTKPFEVVLAKDWKQEDKGSWIMLIPPSFPVGMDIYEMGTYSAKDPKKQAELMIRVRQEMSLEWARRIGKPTKPENLKPAKVGAYDALYYETTIPSQLEKDITWRQWVFTAGDQCYFIVSTILPDLESKIYPDVQQMLGTFKMKSP